MDTPEWRTSIRAHGRTESGRRIPVVVGVVAVGDNDSFAVAVDDVPEILMDDDQAQQLAVNIQVALAEKQRGRSQ